MLLLNTYRFITSGRKLYKHNKLKIIAPTWDDEFELPAGCYSVSDIKKHETLTTVSPIHVYINRINNRSVFKIKDGYKLELQMPETVMLFCSTKKLIDKTKSM